MAFVVEDGTGVTDANSYADVAFADAYFADRGISTWTGSDTEKQAALVRAADYMDARFGAGYGGAQATTTQGLGYPRKGLYGKPAPIPAKLLVAQCEYALRSLASGAPLAQDPAITGGVATYQTRRKIGPMEFEYAPVKEGIGSTLLLYPVLPFPDAIMATLSNTAGRSYR